MPRCTEPCADFPLTCLPPSRTRPLVAGMEPAATENSVVLPAPLGPMRPRISPSSSRKSTLSTARRPPKCLLTDSPTRMAVTWSRFPPVAEPAAGPQHQAGQAERLEENDQHQQDAVQAQVELGIAGEQELLDDHEDDRPGGGAQDGAEAADDAY